MSMHTGLLAVAMSLAIVPQAVALAEAAPAPATAPTNYHVGFSVRNAGCTIWLNDVEVARSEEAEESASLKLNKWIMPGKNRLSFQLQPRGAQAIASVRLETQFEGEMTGDGTKIFSFETGKTRFDATRRTVGFDAAAPLPGELWAKAERLVLDAALVAEARAVALEVHDLLARNDIPRLTARFAFQIADSRRANHWAVPQDLEAYVRKALTTQDDPLEALEAEHVRVVLVAGDRLARVVGADGEDALRGKGEPGERTTVPLYLARLNGKLVIAR